MLLSKLNMIRLGERMSYATARFRTKKATESIIQTTRHDAKRNPNLKGVRVVLDRDTGEKVVVARSSWRAVHYT
jgi:hypothetical protein